MVGLLTIGPAPAMQCLVRIAPPHLDFNVNHLLDMSMGVLATTAGTLFGVRILEEILMLVGFLTSACRYIAVAVGCTRVLHYDNILVVAYCTRLLATY